MSVKHQNYTPSQAHTVRCLLALLGIALLTVACGQPAYEAEARARRWDVRAVRLERDVVYAEYGRQRLILDVYRPPESMQQEMERAYRRAGAPVALKLIEAPNVHGFWGNPYYFPEAKQHAVEFFRKHLKSPNRARVRS